MKLKAWIIFILTILMITFLPFSAIAEKTGFYSAIKAGIYSPETDDLEDFDDDFAGEVAFGYYLNQNFALELGLGYTGTDADFSGFDPMVLGTFTEDDDFTIMPLTLSAKGILPLNESLELFGLAGGGIYFTDFESDVTSTGLGTFKYEDNDNPFGVHAGLGFNYNITNRLSFGVEGKYFWAEAEFEDDVIGIPVEMEAELDGFIVTAGLSFFFGAQPAKAAEMLPLDSDGDGVYDNQDRCPGTPMGVTVDRLGCPLDSDCDGVHDYQDKCPDTPEGVKVNKEGCPLDTDGDGVYDHLDKCPDTPKGVKVDKTGCSLIADSDGDGVPNDADKCPRTPKGATVNEFGCWVCENVNFDINKADIKSESYKNLDEQVTFLTQHSELIVEIQGHTDNTGTKEYNQMLSEKRANAVRDYLIKNDIKKDRLIAKGYGLTLPLASNNTKEGRAQNRRVQFSVCYDLMVE